MPLFSIPHREALHNIKSNRQAYWSSTVDRAHHGLLHTDVRRRPLLHPGDAVYAIGSCFAGEIERALLSRGYDVLSLPQPDAPPPDLNRNSLNRYNTASMRLEFERCLLTP